MFIFFAYLFFVVDQVCIKFSQVGAYSIPLQPLHKLRAHIVAAVGAVKIWQLQHLHMQQGRSPLVAEADLLQEAASATAALAAPQPSAFDP